MEEMELGKDSLQANVSYKIDLKYKRVILKKKKNTFLIIIVFSIK